MFEILRKGSRNFLALLIFTAFCIPVNLVSLAIASDRDLYFIDLEKRLVKDGSMPIKWMRSINGPTSPSKPAACPSFSSFAKVK